MDEGLISKRYAKALYEHASGLNQENELANRMKILIDNFFLLPRLKEVLNNPVVSVEDKTALLKNLAGSSPEKCYLDFIELIITNRREKYVLIIAFSYLCLYRKKKNIQIVKLVSAENIQSDILLRIKKEVESRLSGTVEFQNHVDPSILGGIIFQLNDLRLDASLTSQLERIRRQLLQNNRTIV